jgi:hypothetical protein
MNKYRIYLVYFILFVLIWLLTYYTPIDIGDDIAYMFVFGENGHPIHSVIDCFVSQYNHYFVQHGRVPVMFLVQLFDAVLGKELYNICNGIVFCITLFLLIKYTFHKQSVFPIILAVFLIFFFIPAFGDTHLWLTGSIDYMWASTFILLFLFLFRRYSKETPSLHLLWICPFSLIVGMCHEAFSLSLSFGLFVYLYIERKHLFNTAALPITIAFIIGTLLLSFAPGTQRRLQLGSGIDMMYFLKRIVAGIYSLFFTLRIFWFFIILFIYACRKNRIDAKQFLMQHILVFSAMIVSPAILFVDARYGGRINYATEVLALIMLLHLINRLEPIKYKKFFSFTCALILLLSYIPVASVARENFNNYRNVKKQLEEKTQLVKVPQLRKVNSFESRYLHGIVGFGEQSYFFALNPDDLTIHNTSIIYDIPGLIFIPENIYSYFEDSLSNNSLKTFITKEGWPYMIKEVPNQVSIKGAKLILRETNYADLPFYIRLIAHKLDRYNTLDLSVRSAVVEMLGRRFLFVEKSFPEVNERIVGIKVEYDSI